MTSIPCKAFQRGPCSRRLLRQATSKLSSSVNAQMPTGGIFILLLASPLPPLFSTCCPLCNHSSRLGGDSIDDIAGYGEHGRPLRLLTTYSFLRFHLNSEFACRSARTFILSFCLTFLQIYPLLKPTTMDYQAAPSAAPGGRGCYNCECAQLFVYLSVTPVLLNW
jgi:hypothetical protein